MRPELEAELTEHLRIQRENDVPGMLRKQADWMLDHDRKDAEHHAMVIGKLEGQNHRIETLEGAAKEVIEKVEFVREKSGSWETKHMQAEVEEAKGKALWWRNNVTSILVGIAMTIIGATIATLFNMKK